MKITFLGAAHEVTGSCTLVEACGKRFLVDCGMEQGPDIYENSELPVAPADIDFVFLTHAHIDHSGKLPLLTKNGFTGKVYSTDATRDLAAIMLADSASIQQAEAVWRDRRAKRSGGEGYTPMYTVDDVNALMRRFEAADYGAEVAPASGITAVFYDAGHLLGSASIRITLSEGDERRVIVFSGDVGTPDRPIICDPTVPDGADAVVVESTYGDRVRDAEKRNERWDIPLARVIDETMARGGNVVIPSFAVGRTQELLYSIRRIKEAHLTKADFPVWLDSPLAIEATNIYLKTKKEYFDAETRALIEMGINPIGFPGLFLAVSSDESKAINSDKTPKVIISASGMCEAGRIRHHLKYNLWRPESTVLFVGYQVEGTLGRKLLDGAGYVNLFGEEIKVMAHIERLDGVSGHADKNGLLEWLRGIGGAPGKVFVNHGADTVCDDFAAAVTAELGIPAVAPYSGDAFDLVDLEQVAVGSRKKAERGHAAERRRSTSAVWSRLYAAGMRLMSVIEHMRGGKSKDLAALTSRINSLCDKYGKDHN